MNSGAALSAETSEILADLGSIAGGLDEVTGRGRRRGRGDFMQIAEFVRIAALGIFTERAAPVRRRCADAGHQQARARATADRQPGVRAPAP
ncbi:MAG: hypothetical protein IPO61_07175 [Gammaproteobacteria bacterium]|nr:hypothetical protein [Gammaproteobacteria bacterium]